MLYISEQKLLLIKVSGRRSPTKVLRTPMLYIAEQRILLIKATSQSAEDASVKLHLRTEDAPDKSYWETLSH